MNTYFMFSTSAGMRATGSPQSLLPSDGDSYSDAKPVHLVLPSHLGSNLMIAVLLVTLSDWTVTWNWYVSTKTIVNNIAYGPASSLLSFTINESSESSSLGSSSWSELFISSINNTKVIHIMINLWGKQDCSRLFLVVNTDVCSSTGRGWFCGFFQTKHFGKWLACGMIGWKYQWDGLWLWVPSETGRGEPTRKHFSGHSTSSLQVTLLNRAMKYCGRIHSQIRIRLFQWRRGSAT